MRGDLAIGLGLRVGPTTNNLPEIFFDENLRMTFI